MIRVVHAIHYTVIKRDFGQTGENRVFYSGMHDDPIRHFFVPFSELHKYLKWYSRMGYVADRIDI
uniref:Uncharacterized protein n=1 Tax=Siphoviridae sp. ctWT735 TaxID=2825538 RepID=A0A8S5TU65_9CAUD|nr:MAG TPA: hypothetical protein [Siphoviridae sp. ctWT735]DAT98634.1 MAG TPA: hypothetical protein [Caudoviricetes sp.]